MAKLGTSHLPTEVVKTPFTLAIWSITDRKDPREGAISVGLIFGSRRNPADLTADEREYILAGLKRVCDDMRDGKIPQGGEGSTEDWESKYYFAGYPPYTSARSGEDK